jgi:predicted metal-binding protein
MKNDHKKIKMKKASLKNDDDLKSFLKRAVEVGALNAKLISPKDIVTSNWVRWKCQFGCGGYNSSLACPPYTPKPDETRKMLDEYKNAILFEASRGNTKKIAKELENEIFLSGYYKALGLGAGPCRLCRECSFNEGCRHPGEALPSMEACGIDVYETVRRQGLKIEVVTDYNEAGRFFGVVLIK